jgi:hypothetical protein
MANKTVQRIMDEVPRGHPIDSGMLRDIGISAALASSLEKSGWLQRLSQGIYLLRGDELSIAGIVAFLGRRIPGLHIGARSALRWHLGFQSDPDNDIVTMWGQKPFDRNFDYGECLEPVTVRSSIMLMSSPERALLELASDIGKEQSLEEALQLVEGKHRVDPIVLERMISRCTRVKVVRLVRDLCLHAGFAWTSGLQKQTDRLGDGKRWSNRTSSGQRLTLRA